MCIFILFNKNNIRMTPIINSAKLNYFHRKIYSIPYIHNIDLPFHYSTLLDHLHNIRLIEYSTLNDHGPLSPSVKRLDWIIIIYYAFNFVWLKKNFLCFLIGVEKKASCLSSRLLRSMMQSFMRPAKHPNEVEGWKKGN